MSIKNKLSFDNYHRIPSTFVLFFVSSLVFLLAILFLFGIHKAHATGGLYIYNASGTVAFDITSSGILEYGATTSGQITSTVASGTAPLVIASPTLNTNLNADLLDGYHAADLVTSPVGAITLWGSATAPDGWLLCDGSSLLRAGTYAGLFAVIGTTFGTADGTHFNLPDMRGVFPKGAGTTNRTLGKDANGNYYAGTLGTYLTDKFQGHYHSNTGLASYIAGSPAYATNYGGYTTYNNGSGVTYPTADGTNGTPRTGLTTEPQSLGLYYIIKYSGAGLPVSGLVVASPVSGSGTTASPLTADLTRIKPASDSTTAVQINKADGTTNVLNVDTTNGYVGIGTTVPDTKLDIEGSESTSFTSVEITNTHGSVGRWLLLSNSNTSTYAPAKGFGIRGGDPWGTKLVIDPTGNVGIGTTAPKNLLHIRGSGTSGQVTAAMILENLSSGTLGLDITGTAGASYARFLYGGGPGTGTNGLTSAMNIVLEGTNAGKIGIGTTAPEFKLHLYGGGGTRILVQSSATSDAGYRSRTTLGDWEAGTGIGVAADTYVIYKHISPAGPKLTINSSGYVSMPGGHGDLAENYQISGTALRGSLISIDNTTAKTAITSSPTQPNLLGVVSTKPGAVMDVDGGFQVGYDTKPTYNNEKVPVALTGAVPTLVTSQNGTINIGDAIGLSNNPGFGAKMITAGNIVGKALETLDASSTCQPASSTESIIWPEDDGKNTLKPCFGLPDGTIVGKIMVAVNVSWYDSGVMVLDSKKRNKY